MEVRNNQASHRYFSPAFDSLFLSCALNEMETATSMARLDAEELNKDAQHDVGALNASAVQVPLAGKECRVFLPLDDR
jgi:hypothetical protein